MVARQARFSAFAVWLVLFPLWYWLAPRGANEVSDTALTGTFVALGVALAAYGVVICVEKRRPSLLDPDVAFLAVYVVVGFGYLLFLWIGYVDFSGDVIVFPHGFGQTTTVLLVGLFAFVSGFLVTKASARRGFHTTLRSGSAVGADGDSQQTRRLRRVGRRARLAFYAGAVLHFTGLALVGPAALAEIGYAAVQSPERHGVTPLVALVLTVSRSLLLPGLALALWVSVSRRRRVFPSTRFALLYTVTCLGFVVIGDRGGLFPLVAIPALAFHHGVRPLKNSTLLAACLVVVVAFSIMPAVRSQGVQPAAMIGAASAHLEADIRHAISFVAELGSSVNTVNVVVTDVPAREPYWLGSSWAGAVVHVVPGLQGLAARGLGVGRSPSKWFTHSYWGEGRSGRAFSLAAEGYLNFGVTGVMIELFLIGALCQVISIGLRSRHLVWWPVSAVTSCLVLLSVRNHLNVLVSPAVHCLAVTAVLAGLVKLRVRARSSSVRPRFAWSSAPSHGGELKSIVKCELP